MRQTDAVVLMGPPGSGKTHLGHTIAASGRAVYREFERELVEKFGCRDSFIARKTEALDYLEKSLCELTEDSTLPVIIEATGVSDAPILARIASRWRVAIVCLLPPKETCVERIATRDRSRNLDSDPERAGRFHDFWIVEIAPRYTFALRLDGLDCDRDAASVIGLLTA